MKTTNAAGIKVKSAIKAAGIGYPGMNHNRAGIKVKSAVKAGTSMSSNHNARLLAI